MSLITSIRKIVCRASGSIIEQRMIAVDDIQFMKKVKAEEFSILSTYFA